MNIFLNNTSGVPLYEQLYGQIKDLIIERSLTKGEALPSMRILASDLHVSIITVKRAYEDLARDGFVYSVPAKGYFIAEINYEKIKTAAEKEFSAKLKDICSGAKKIGLTLNDLYSILENAYNQ